MRRDIWAEVVVPCPREYCDGEWRFEGLVYPPEPDVGINAHYAIWNGVGYAHEHGDVHLSDCMSMIRLDTVAELVAEAEHDAIMEAIER